MVTMATDDPLIKGFDEKGPIRYMNADEIKERDALQIANTATNLRARVLSELSKMNGHSSNGGKPVTH